MPCADKHRHLYIKLSASHARLIQAVYLICRSALMNACCSYQPADRPSFSDVAEYLEQILADFTATNTESQRVTV